MRLYLIIILTCITSFAKAKTNEPAPSWWCYIGVDNIGDTTTECSRSKEFCETAILSDEFINTPNCFGQHKAAVFIIIHKNDYSIEFEVKPDIKACKAISRQIAADSQDIIVSDCISVL